MKRFFVINFLILLLFGAVVHADGDSAGDLPMQVRRLSDRVIVVTCFGNNITAIAAQKGLVIIDTHLSQTTAAEIRKVIEKEFGRKDIAYVVNTHGHWDHASGNQAFIDAVIIGHERCGEFMQRYPANRPGNIARFKKWVQEAKEKLETLDPKSDEAMKLRDETTVKEMIAKGLEHGFVVTVPTLTFRERLTLDMGDLTLEMIYPGNAHTDNDILIYVPEEELVVTGDIIFAQKRVGVFTTGLVDYPRVISILDDVLKRGVKSVVIGHKDILDRDGLKTMRDKFNELWVKKFGCKESAARVMEKVIETSGIKAALGKYVKLKSKHGENYNFLEEDFNALGYKLLGRGNVQDAIEVFKLNVESFPNSANAFDSLGEVYMKNGDKKNAVINYKKSLELNPGNKNAKKMLKELEGK